VVGEREEVTSISQKTGNRGCRVKDDFKHPDMLESGWRRCSDGRADGVFGRHKGLKQ